MAPGRACERRLRESSEMAITVQSTYPTAPAAGFAGMVANGEKSNRISRSVEDAGGMAFGVAAFRGSGDHGCTATPTANKFLGIVIADVGQVPGLGGTADTLAQYTTASLLNEGVIYVNASVAVNQGDAAYVTAGGAITNVSTSNTAIPARFDGTIASAGIVPLRVTRS
jgi:hypothetical protein